MSKSVNHSRVVLHGFEETLGTVRSESQNTLGRDAGWAHLPNIRATHKPAELRET